MDQSKNQQAGVGGVELIVVAPLEEELRPFLDSIGGKPVGKLPAGAVWEGEWAGGRVVAAAIGDGAGRSSRSLEVLLPRYAPERLLLIGIAGGLSPDLRVEDQVRARRVVDTGAESSGEWESRGGGDGQVFTSDRILGVAEQKRALWRRLGEPQRATVDLESAAFVRAAESADVSWTVLRAVSDAQSDDLPLDLTAASDSEGHVVRHRVVRQLAMRPSAIGGLRRLRRNLTLCAEGLDAAARGWIERSA